MTKPTKLIEVWGDTVDSRHLLAAIVIGAVISLSAFLIARHFLLGVVAQPAMAGSYAMLIGLGGCLVAGGLCAKLFAPKRVVLEHSTDPTWRDTAMAQLAGEAGDLGKLADLPPEVAAEMREVGLYDLFAAYEKKLEAAEAGAASTTGVPGGATVEPQADAASQASRIAPQPDVAQPDVTQARTSPPAVTDVDHPPVKR